MLRIAEFLRFHLTRVQALMGSDRQPTTAPPAPASNDPPHIDDAAQFEQACALHQRGQLDQAEALLRTLLEKYPKDFDLLHRLGMVQGQRGNFGAALELIEKALVVEPDNAAAHGSLGNCLKGLGQHEAALASYNRALTLRPEDPDILNNRGATLRDLMRFETALDSFDRALSINPNHYGALHNRSATLRGLKRPIEALACADQALSIIATDVPAYINRGIALADMKQYDEALASFEQALALSPDNLEALQYRAQALGNLKRREEALVCIEHALRLAPDDPVLMCYHGIVLLELKRYQDALASFDQALSIRADYADALVNRGAALSELHRYADALDSLSNAIVLEPGSASAYYNRGIVLGALNRFDEALADYEKALALRPDFVQAQANRGAVLRDLRRYEDALHGLNQALAVAPDHISALFNRANLLLDLKRTDAAVQDFTRVVAIDPGYDFAPSLLLHAKMSCCDWRDSDNLAAAIAEGIRQGKHCAEPFCCIGNFDNSELLKRCAEIYVAHKFPPAAHKPSQQKTNRRTKIRLGYVAGEFRQHATSVLAARLFETHDADRFELFAFDNGWDDGSPMRQRLQNAFANIVNISGMGDDEAANAVKMNEIDILIDLNGHVGLKRTGIFSRRAAPVQVNWLGYPGTMGAPFMDYIVADATVIPPEHEPYYSEKVVRLPDTCQINDSTRPLPEQTPGRAHVQLPESAFVFCCFNNNYKITPHVFDIWMRLLRKVEHSVLWLLSDNPLAACNLRAEAAARGIDPHRLVFAPRMDLPDHLARHRLADLFLDTLPCNAHTTASDALWAGLPVLTCMGSTFAGRVAGSLLHAVGLPELATRCLADYEALALKLATAPEILAEFRARLARNRTTHPLFNVDRFRRHIESAYLTMHERQLRGLVPESFTIAP